MSGQFNVTSHYSHVAANHRESFDLCISADHADISADLGVPCQFNVTADNHKIAANSPFQC
ncbi:MAG: hypothetical protein F4148_07770 [Caldilineaceae bacterium SB0675_bin_29]|uniref:Uncharacterized protein n=1 Tax=Caldilineaceae bacterium SB0675_bin_29 TaxID=2605266 RepID=A0A6B1G0J3_9CHLR|nr:hypothetical protein [Caldilineaceae bacterium SB0675_bin_29]